MIRWWKMLSVQNTILQDRSELLNIMSDVTSELDFDRLFELIIARVSEIMNAERTSLYVIDWEKNELWTKAAEGVAKISLPIGEGISGRVAENGKILNIMDAWNLPYFNKVFDTRNNFRTRSVLCMPVSNYAGERIGILQVINKKSDGHFNKEDELCLQNLATQIGIALDNALLHEELRISFESSIRALSATVDARHPLTAGHSERVSSYALLIAQEMGLKKQEIENLKYASLLHDIGKIGISDCILLKKGDFTLEEKKEMESHTVKTRDILEKFHFPKTLHEVPEIAFCHHERIDGNGYPNGLTGDNLHLCSKIMAVADVFDALTSRRDYPKYSCEKIMGFNPMPLSEVITIIKENSGTCFDPSVVKAFSRRLRAILLQQREKHFSSDYADEGIKYLLSKN